MDERKYTILFADDEYWTREKIRRMIQWEKYGLEFLEPAVDGEEVLQKMEESRPDILITDINMPFLNGVELLEQVHARFPDVVTFVISGYDDFEYVKGTFMSGAMNYLKKPVTKVELVNAIVKALEAISEREQEKRQLVKAASLIQDREFSQMIQRDRRSFVPAISVNGKEPFSGMSLVLVKIHNLSESIHKNYQDLALFSYNFKKKAKELLGGECDIVFNNIYRSNEFVVVSEKPRKDLLQFAERMKQYLKDFKDTCITICISGHSYSMESIHMAYVEAVGLLMARRYCRKDELILGEEQEKEPGAVRQRFNKEYGKQLNNFLVTGNYAAVQQTIFESIGLADCEKEGWTYLEVKQTLRQVLNIRIDFGLQEQVFGSVADVENIMESLDKIAEDMDIRALCAMMEDVIDQLKPEKDFVATDSMRDIVQKAAAWIDSHYAESLTLVSIAERYHVESSYFSKIFRQEIGINLILYITQKRIEKSKEYIRGSDMGLMEIAFMVGYDDYTYFSRVFKKNEGMSPREYRALSKEKKELP